MTPLLGTKTSSAPVGDMPGGDTRAARSLLSCALWRCMGRLWRGMGGMGRPEPLSAHRPHQQQGLSGFHETRKHGFFRRGCARDTQSETPARTAANAARSLLSCALWRSMGRLWRGMGGRRPPHRHTACKSFTDHETRDMKHGPFRISHEFPRFPVPPRCPRAGLDLGWPRSKRRSLPLLPPSGLLPPPRTQQEPMFRMGNVLDCVNITIGRDRVNRVE